MTRRVDRRRRASKASCRARRSRFRSLRSVAFFPPTMPRLYQIIPLVERTPAWWDWRRNGVGSSDAAAILGEKRSLSVERLILEKQYSPIRNARHFEHARSATRERQARAHYCRTVGIVVEPV